MSALSDLGPVLRPAGEMRAIANEVHQLGLILLDVTGPRGDPLRAARTLDRLRAVVGPGPDGADHLERGAGAVPCAITDEETNKGG